MMPLLITLRMGTSEGHDSRLLMYKIMANQSVNPHQVISAESFLAERKVI